MFFLGAPPEGGGGRLAGAGGGARRRSGGGARGPVLRRRPAGAAAEGGGALARVAVGRVRLGHPLEVVQGRLPVAGGLVGAPQLVVDRLGGVLGEVVGAESPA